MAKRTARRTGARGRRPPAPSLHMRPGALLREHVSGHVWVLVHRDEDGDWLCVRPLLWRSGADSRADCRYHGPSFSTMQGRLVPGSATVVHTTRPDMVDGEEVGEYTYYMVWASGWPHVIITAGCRLWASMEQAVAHYTRLLERARENDGLGIGVARSLRARHSAGMAALRRLASLGRRAGIPPQLLVVPGEPRHPTPAPTQRTRARRAAAHRPQRRSPARRAR